MHFKCTKDNQGHNMLNHYEKMHMGYCYGYNLPKWLYTEQTVLNNHFRINANHLQ